MKKLILIPAVVLIFAFGIFAHSTKTNANPQGFYQTYIGTTATAAGNIASTTIVYMTPGTATTSIIWDSGLRGASAQGSESAELIVQLKASSSATTLLMNQEFSQGSSGVDCQTTPLQCDWYQSSLANMNSVSTTTAELGFNVATLPQWSFQFASSTSVSGGLGLAGDEATSTRSISIQTPTRYTRIVFSLKIGGQRGAIWAAIVAKKQNP